MRLLDSDVGVYVTAGLFMSLVFLVAVAVVAVTPTLSLTPRTLAGFAIGFFLSMSVYYVAYGIYRYVEVDEQPYGKRE